ncbi:MAG: hypothetical protein ACFFCI_07855 [Promethearchaeota archaeon]
MTKSVLEEIERGWRLLNEGKEEEALKIIIQLKKNEDLTPEELLRCELLKGIPPHYYILLQENWITPSKEFKYPANTDLSYTRG